MFHGICPAMNPPFAMHANHPLAIGRWQMLSAPARIVCQADSWMFAAKVSWLLPEPPTVAQPALKTPGSTEARMGMTEVSTGYFFMVPCEGYSSM
jgi:hypothetical protein